MVRNLLLTLFSTLLLQSCAYYFGNVRVKKVKPDLSEITVRLKPDSSKSVADWQKHPIVLDWAAKTPDEDWKKRGKTDIPRILLAKLAMREDIEAVNQYLSKLEPWGKSGTNWLMNPNGDYDFSEIVLVNILYLFGQDTAILYPESEKRLLNVLLTEKKPKPFPKTPNSLCLLRETENHILMKETVRYLRRAWIFKKSLYQSRREEKQLIFLENWMIHHLKELKAYGLWEYNSIPYLAYTIVPLLTLEAHAPELKIRLLAGEILDKLNYFYALGSLDFKRVVPFRRQLTKFGWSELSADPHSSLMKSWYYAQKGFAVSSHLSPHRTHQSLLALLLNYRLPDSVIEILDNGADEENYTRIGHGWQSSPEFHWKCKNALFSGGGVQRGKISQLVPRPIVLMLRDSASSIESCFHIKGGKKARELNNTGIFKALAIGQGPVSIPQKAKALQVKGNWSLYSVDNTKDFLIVYSSMNFGLLYYAYNPALSSEIIFENIVKLNTDPANLFIYPNGDKVTYNVKAPKNKWVIKSFNRKEMQRKFDYWNGIIQ